MLRDWVSLLDRFGFWSDMIWNGGFVDYLLRVCTQDRVDGGDAGDGRNRVDFGDRHDRIPSGLSRALDARR